MGARRKTESGNHFENKCAGSIPASASAFIQREISTMKPERPSLLTHASSDGNIDWDQYQKSMVNFLLSEEDKWEDWPEDNTTSPLVAEPSARHLPRS